MNSAQMTRGRLLFIHEVDYLDKPIFEMHEFPEGLAARGWSVQFIDFVENSSDRRAKASVSRLGEAEIDLESVPSIGSGIVRRLLAALVAIVWLPIRIARIRPSAVVLYAVPTFGWQTVLACRFLRIPTIYRAIDLSSDIRETALRRLVAKAERYVAKQSTISCPNTEELGMHLTKLGATNVAQLFPGFDEQQLVESTSGDQKTILFMGTLFPFAGLEKFLADAADKLRARPEVKVRVLGSGDAEDSICSTIAELSLNNQVMMVGFVPYERLFEEMKDASVAIIPFELLPLTHVALPGKVPQYLRAGLPVVSTPLQGLQELLPEGFGVRYRTPGTEFVNEVWGLLDDEHARRELVRLGTQRLDEVATWETSLDGFERVVEKSQSLMTGRDNAR